MVNIPNSMTVLYELLPVAIVMTQARRRSRPPLMLSAGAGLYLCCLYKPACLS